MDEGKSQGGSGPAPHSRLTVPYSENGTEKEATLYFRSPEGVLYYLGELMRLEEKSGLIPEACIEKHLEPLFVAFSRAGQFDGSGSQCRAAVSVQYEGTEFIIPEAARPDDLVCDPECDPECKSNSRSGGKYARGFDQLQCLPGQSMHAFSLVSQLIALQKSAKDVPTTSVIRAISQ